jgi:23S rRNA (adenine2503-C2)-methyltransferase
VRLLGLDAAAAIGRRFHRAGQRKVVLNFALAAGLPVDVAALRATFDPACFAVKLTPLNPTDRARHHALRTILDAAHPDAAAALVAELAAAGFDTVVSIGEPDEIAIGSNCGQVALRAGAQASRGAPHVDPGSAVSSTSP